MNKVTILILLETLLQPKLNFFICSSVIVTILILLETLLQLHDLDATYNGDMSHNPYFTGNSFTTY